MSFWKYLENGLFQNEKNFQIKKTPTFKERFVFTNMLESTNLSVCIHDLLNCGRNIVYDIRLRHWIVNISWLYKCTTIKCVLVVNWIMFYSIKMKKFLFLSLSESFENISQCYFYFLRIRTKPNILLVIPTVRVLSCDLQFFLILGGNAIKNLIASPQLGHTFILIPVVNGIMEKVSTSESLELWLCYLTWQRRFCRYD